MNLRWLAGWLALVLAACASMVPYAGEPELAAGVRVYEQGRLDDAARYLQRGLDLGLRESDQVAAHKYLAFIHCALGREAPCRDEFRLALAIQPSFQLTPAEAGHPRWGPAFQGVKRGG
jgi:Tfp pilus assembly protein PilF